LTGILLHGAFISFTKAFLRTVPNVIPFQFNPEQMTHGLARASTAGKEDADPLTVNGDPEETFGFSLLMSARDMIADGRPATAALAAAGGLASRIAALEMLQVPFEKLDEKTKVTALQSPAVLFVWGPGRIVPVVLTTLTFTETLFDELLNPIQAQVEVALRVLTKIETESINGPLKKVATMAAKYHGRQRQVLALENLATAAEAPIGVLPF
jgi:hypothetical protein